MIEKVGYKQLEQIAFALLSIIALAVVLLFLEVVPLIILKFALLALLIMGIVFVLALRSKIRTALESRKINFRSAYFKFEKIYSSNIIGIIVSDFEGRVLDANDAFLNLVGYTKDDLKRELVRWDKLTVPAFRKKDENAIHELLTKGFSTPYEKQYIKKDGTYAWVLIGSSKLGDNEKGDAVTFAIDISDKKLADQKVEEYQKLAQRQQQELLSVLMDAPAFVTIRRGEELRYQFVNKAVIELSQRNDHIGRTSQELYPSSANSEDAKMAFEVYKTGKTRKGIRHKLQYFNEQKELITMYLDYVITPVFDHDGKVDGVATYGFDVTDLVLANQEMAISKDRFAFVADTISHKVWMAEPEGKLTYLNKSWTDYLKLSLEEVNALNWRNIYHSKDVDKVIEAWNHAVLNQEQFELEADLRRWDNTYRTHLVKAYPLKDANGEIVMWVGSNTDIHDQKLEMQELRESEDHFKSLADGTPFMIWRSDKQGKCIYVNQQWCEFTGLSFEESLGLGFSKRMKEDPFEERQQIWRKAVEERSGYESKFQLQRNDGEWRWVYAKARPYYSHDEFKGFIGSLVDITDQELATQAFKDAAAKKDEFLSIASHELKTPLTSIKAFVQLLGKTLNKTEKGYTFVEKANEHCLRLEKLISDLLDVSKINAGKLSYRMEELSFDRLLRESVESVQHTSPKHEIVIERSVDAVLEGDRLRLEQVINNFLTNAVKYSPEATRVLVRSEQQGKNLIVSIQDFGVGIEEKNIGNLFDRYYRVDNTAMRFQGLGLGLFIASEILKRHNGTFWVESEPGQGSIFYFLLPLKDQTDGGKVAISTDTVYQDDFIEIRYNAEKRWLESNWSGFHNLSSVQSGCQRILELLEKNNCSKVLNDNSELMGSWSEASEWVGKEWFPMMEKAGLTHFAWVYSPSRFSKLAAEKSLNVLEGKVVTRLFKDTTEAAEWLEKQLAD